MPLMGPAGDADQVYEFVAEPEAVRLVLSPSQILREPEIMEIVGIGITLSVTTVELWQPSTEAPVTV